MGEFVARNMLGWFKKINKRKKLLHLVGCLYYYDLVTTLLRDRFCSDGIWHVLHIKLLNCLQIKKEEANTYNRNFQSLLK